MPQYAAITIKDKALVDHNYVPTKTESNLYMFAEKLADGVSIGFPRATLRAEEVTSGIKSSLKCAHPRMFTEPATGLTRVVRAGRISFAGEWDKTSLLAERDDELTRAENLLKNPTIRNAFLNGEPIFGI